MQERRLSIRCFWTKKCWTQTASLGVSFVRWKSYREVVLFTLDLTPERQQVMHYSWGKVTNKPLWACVYHSLQSGFELRRLNVYFAYRDDTTSYDTTGCALLMQRGPKWETALQHVWEVPHFSQQQQHMHVCMAHKYVEELEKLWQEMMRSWQCESKRGEPDGCLVTRSLLLKSVAATSACSANWPSQPHQLGNARHHTLRLSWNPGWITDKAKESLDSCSLTNGPCLSATLQLGGDIIYTKGNNWR